VAPRTEGRHREANFGLFLIEERAKKDYGFGRNQKIGDPHEFNGSGAFHLFVCSECDGHPTWTGSRDR
jgi:hypothetical protein